MGNFNPNDYVDVAERVHWFHKRHPDGRIVTSLESWDDRGIVFRAQVYREPTDPAPTTGWAHEVPGAGMVNKTNAVENCETSAIGRALANMDMPGDKAMARKVAEDAGEGAAPWDRGSNAAPRPSRQEMQKAQREPEADGGRPKAERVVKTAADLRPASNEILTDIAAEMERRHIPAGKRKALEDRLTGGSMTAADAETALAWVQAHDLVTEGAGA